MSFLDRAIRKGISKGIGDAVSKAVQQVIEPKATELANKAAEPLDRAARQPDDTQQPSCASRSCAPAQQAQAPLQWGQVLSAYPVWCCGGSDFSLEEFDDAYYFTACFDSSLAAQNAVVQYREILMQNGFRMAGEYPSAEHLYKMVDGKCCHVDTEHCFDSDHAAPTVGFSISEPKGGFRNAQSEPKKSGWHDLFNR